MAEGLGASHMPLNRLSGIITTLIILWSGIAFSAESTPSPVKGLDRQGMPKVEIFCDFRCPFCAKLFVSLRAEMTLLKMKPEVTFHHLLLHDGARRLSLFYEAVTRIDSAKSDDIIFDLFRYRDRTKDRDLTDFLNALSMIHGIDYGLVASKMHGRDIQQRLLSDASDARIRKVDGTPTVFVDGKELPEGPPEKIAKALAQVFSQSQATKATEAKAN
jgi:Thioredoxin